MIDPRVEKLAEVLVRYSLAVRPGDKVYVQGGPVAEPLMTAIYDRILRADGLPFLMANFPGADELLLRHGTDDQLAHVPAPVQMAVETYDAGITVLGSANTKSMSSVDPARAVKRQQGRQTLFKTLIRRIAAGEFRWSCCLFPTQAHAQDAEMSLAEYEDFVYGACLPDPDDPVGYWERFSARQQKIVDWFAGKKRVRVTGPGTDLSLRIDDRVFINCDGHENMPDGEVFTGPVEDSVEGHVHFSYPALYQGREVTGVRLRFEKGRAVEATADKNQEFLNRTLDTDAGSRYVGEFAIGTNEGIRRFTGEILFDEKINGSFHMALGASLPESGGKNESAIHWDMVCDLRDGGRIVVDDELLYENGRFVIEF